MKHDTVITYTIYYDINTRVRTKGFGKTEIILDKRRGYKYVSASYCFYGFYSKVTH